MNFTQTNVIQNSFIVNLLSTEIDLYTNYANSEDDKIGTSGGAFSQPIFLSETLKLSKLQSYRICDENANIGGILGFSLHHVNYIAELLMR